MEVVFGTYSPPPKIPSTWCLNVLRFQDVCALHCQFKLAHYFDDGICIIVSLSSQAQWCCFLPPTKMSQKFIVMREKSSSQSRKTVPQKYIQNLSQLVGCCWVSRIKISPHGSLSSLWRSYGISHASAFFPPLCIPDFDRLSALAAQDSPRGWAREGICGQHAFESHNANKSLITIQFIPSFSPCIYFWKKLLMGKNLKNL